MSRAPSTFRQQDVTKAIKAVAAAGVHIARVEIDKTGKIVIIAKNPTENQPGESAAEVNEWDRVLRLPRYVHGFIDRHGKPRFYFRRAGFGSRPLRGSLYSSQFMDDYEAALAGQSLPIGADRVRPGTMAALALSYFASPQFRGMRSSSQKI